MRLESLSAVIRPRSPWESVDLGVALFRDRFARFATLWAVAVLPVWLILGAVFWKLPVLIFISFWYLKPWYEALLLHDLSQSLFGGRPTTGQTVKAALRYLGRDFAYMMILQRLPVILIGLVVGARPDLATAALISGLFYGLYARRSFLMPVRMLENLRGKSYRLRVRGLRGKYTRVANGVGFAAGLFEGGAFLGLCWFWIGMLPENFLFDVLLSHVAPDEIFGVFGGLFLVASVACYGLALFLSESLYTAAGFGLYIGARTEIEGWDIEMTFRRIGTRFTAAAGSIPGVASLIVGLLLVLLACPAGAQSPGFGETRTPYKRQSIESSGRRAPSSWNIPSSQSASREQVPIREILENQDFTWHVESRSVWRPKRGDGDFGDLTFDPGAARGWMTVVGAVIRVVIWVSLAAATALFIWWLAKAFLAWRRRSVPTESAYEAKIRSESTALPQKSHLPDDVPLAARRLLEQGRARDAVSLLYRGAVAWLSKSGFDVDDSSTENECLVAASGGEVGGTTTKWRPFLLDLTRVWMEAAYRGAPDNAEILRLCGEYPFSRAAL